MSKGKPSVLTCLNTSQANHATIQRSWINQLLNQSKTILQVKDYLNNSEAQCPREHGDEKSHHPNPEDYLIDTPNSSLGTEAASALIVNHHQTMATVATLLTVTPSDVATTPATWSSIAQKNHTEYSIETAAITPEPPVGTTAPPAPSAGERSDLTPDTPTTSGECDTPTTSEENSKVFNIGGCQLVPVHSGARIPVSVAQHTSVESMDLRTTGNFEFITQFLKHLKINHYSIASGYVNDYNNFSQAVSFQEPQSISVVLMNDSHSDVFINSNCCIGKVHLPESIEPTSVSVEVALLSDHDGNVPFHQLSPSSLEFPQGLVYTLLQTKEFKCLQRSNVYIDQLTDAILKYWKVFHTSDNLRGTNHIEYLDFTSGQPFIIGCDYSGCGKGNVLSQVQNEAERPIASGARNLKQSESHYSSYRVEILTLIFAIDSYKFFLTGQKFIVRTDNSAINGLREQRDPKSLLLRWLRAHSSFDFEAQHRVDIKHGKADASSCAPHVSESSPYESDELLDEVDDYSEFTNQVQETILPETPKNAVGEIILHQQNDNVLKKVFQWLKISHKPSGTLYKLLTSGEKHYADVYELQKIPKGLMAKLPTGDHYNAKPNNGNILLITPTQRDSLHRPIRENPSVESPIITDNVDEPSRETALFTTSSRRIRHKGNKVCQNCAISRYSCPTHCPACNTYEPCLVHPASDRCSKGTRTHFCPNYKELATFRNIFSSRKFLEPTTPLQDLIVLTMTIRAIIVLYLVALHFSETIYVDLRSENGQRYSNKTLEEMPVWANQVHCKFLYLFHM